MSMGDNGIGRFPHRNASPFIVECMQGLLRIAGPPTEARSFVSNPKV